MIKTYLQFINENNKSDNIIRISSYLEKKLENMNNNMAKTILDSRYINTDELKKDYADYLDYDEDTGMITYLVNNLESPINVSNPYISNNRSKIKPTKILTKIYKNHKEKTKNITQRDIELFSNEMKPKKEKLEIWKGKDILKAYNSTDLIDLGKFSASCANFNQKKLKELGRMNWSEPEKSWYDVYIDNPENIQVLVVLDDKGEVLGRRMFFTGEQYKDSGEYKKGEKVGMVGNYYGIGGDRSKYDNIILDWVKDNGYETFDKKRPGSFMIQLKNYKYPHFPPFDGFYINLENGVIAYPRPYKEGGTWRSCYKLKQDI